MTRKLKEHCGYAKLYPVMTVLLVLASMWNACSGPKKTAEESAYGPYMSPIINIDSAVNSVKLALNQDSVDAVILLHYSCQGCNEANPAITADNSGKQLKVQSAPLYIFWRKGGSCYVKKIDQFGYYATHRRDYLYDYQLYDFYFRNKLELDTERLLQKNSDFLPEEIEYYKERDISLSANNQYKYVNGYPGVIMYKRHDIEQSFVRIDYWSENETYSRDIDLYKLRPMVDADEQATDLLYGAVPYANNTDFYYHNQMLKVNIWLKLMEGQLFEIESRSNWVSEKDMKLY